MFISLAIFLLHDVTEQLFASSSVQPASYHIISCTPSSKHLVPSLRAAVVKENQFLMSTIFLEILGASADHNWTKQILRATTTSVTFNHKNDNSARRQLELGIGYKHT